MATIVRRVLRAAVAVLARLLLPPAGSVVFRLGALLAFLYGRSWSCRNITYYDQRFSHLAGPLAWRAAERGIVGASFLDPQSRLLDLCCGDGMLDRCYFAPLCGSVIAVDADSSAIRFARRKNSHPRIEWITADLASDELPGSGYHAVFMFASLQYFTGQQAEDLVSRIAAAMLPRAVFVGSVPEAFNAAIGPWDRSSWNEENLTELLQRHFSEVVLWKGPSSQIYFRTRAAAPAWLVPI